MSDAMNKLRDAEAEKYIKHVEDNSHSVCGIAGAYCRADFKYGFDRAVSLLREKYVERERLEVILANAELVQEAISVSKRKDWIDYEYIQPIIRRIVKRLEALTKDTK